MQEFALTRRDIYKYDDDYDVMHVFLDNYDDNGAYYADEEYPDLNVLKSESTEEIAGFIIMEYSKHIEELKKYYPQYFSNLPNLNQ